MNKRTKHVRKEPPCDNKSRLCKTHVEDVTHIISNCHFMSAHYYLPVKHNMVDTLFKKVTKMSHPEIKPTKEINEPKYMHNSVIMNTGGIVL